MKGAPLVGPRFFKNWSKPRCYQDAIIIYRNFAHLYPSIFKCNFRTIYKCYTHFYEFNHVQQVSKHLFSRLHLGLDHFSKKRGPTEEPLSKHSICMPQHRMPLRAEQILKKNFKSFLIGPYF